jgi:hypothetical protein
MNNFHETRINHEQLPTNLSQEHKTNFHQTHKYLAAVSNCHYYLNIFFNSFFVKTVAKHKKLPQNTVPTVIPAVSKTAAK